MVASQNKGGKRTLSEDSDDEILQPKKLHASILNVDSFVDSVFKTPDLFNTPDLFITQSNGTKEPVLNKNLIVLDEYVSNEKPKGKNCDTNDSDHSSQKKPDVQPNDKNLKDPTKNNKINSIDNICNEGIRQLPRANIDLNTQEALLEIQNDSPTLVTVPATFLNEILQSLKDLKAEITVIHDLKSELANIRNDVKSGCKCKANSTANHSDNNNAYTGTRPKTNNSVANQHYETQVRGDLGQLKVNLVPDWGRKFHYRRRQYKNMDKNLRRSEIYKNFLNDRNGVYIVKRSRPKFASDFRDYKIAENLSIKEMEVQIKRWEGYADQSRKNIDSVDLQVYNAINKHRIEDECRKLTQQWNKETKAAENKAAELNINELQFMLDLPTSDPYEGFKESVNNERPNNRGWYKKDYYRNKSRHNQSNPPTTNNGYYTSQFYSQNRYQALEVDKTNEASNYDMDLTAYENPSSYDRDYRLSQNNDNLRNFQIPDHQ